MVSYEIGSINGSLKIVSITEGNFTVDCLKCGNTSVKLSKRQIRTNKSCGGCNKRIPVGKTYGRLLVKECIEKEGATEFLCECACGNFTEKSLQTLKSGKTPSCGCVGGNIKDITSKKVGKLTALKNTYTKTSNGDYLWECECECGGNTTVSVGAFNYKTGTRSCGCAISDSRKSLKGYHGLSDTTEYTSWRKMRERCLSVNCKDYPDYGGAGVTICASWDSFKTFLDDMGYKTDKDFTIDRIDTTQGYSKANCRWTKTHIQARNQNSYKDVTSKYKGVHLRKKDEVWVAKISFGNNSSIIGCYSSEEEAAKAYNTATKIIFEGKESYTHLDETCEYTILDNTSAFVVKWLPIFKEYVKSHY